MAELTRWVKVEMRPGEKSDRWVRADQVAEVNVKDTAHVELRLIGATDWRTWRSGGTAGEFARLIALLGVG